ncbi:rhodanese-like domain-containing protein [Edwardsiella tarda]|uniref:rhodanese-like domain-containing protein n=1 Tax=Edwardsiella tarda TaxID=636 RepID=UPI003F65A2D0
MKPLFALLTTLWLALSLNANAASQPLPLTALQAQQGIIIDTRPSAFYNGWPAQGRSGHEPGALNLAASWLPLMDDGQLRQWADAHHITPQQTLALYGSPAEINAVTQRLTQLGFPHVTTLSDALTQPARLQRLAHYEQLVYPQWIADLQQGKTVANAPHGKWKLFEAAWGAPKQYLISHIPGAGYIDTNTVESEPLWNKVSDAQLKALLAKQGIRHDTTVILYGRDVYAAARVAQILLYAGVQDVRLLDGGFQTWQQADLPVELGLPADQKPAADFGAPLPGAPQLMLSTAQARQLLGREDASLVSIRSWPEFIGTTSGYSYIKPKGEIAGARWGHAGSDATHMEDFHNPDGTMRSADDIAAMWRTWHITPNQQVAFYCGTGWRASEAFMYARAMGWPHIGVYDGGWYEWSANPANPEVRGARGPQSSWR